MLSFSFVSNKGQTAMASETPKWDISTATQINPLEIFRTAYLMGPYNAGPKSALFL